MKPAIVERITDHQRAQLVSQAVTWRATALATAALDRSSAEQAVAALYRYASLRPPEAFLWYPSPAAAFEDFEAWAPRTGRLLNRFWSYQLPICAPGSYFRRHLRCDWCDAAVVDLAIERWPNAYGALVYAKPLPEVTGALISKNVLDECYVMIAAAVGDIYLETANSALETLFPAAFQTLENRHDTEQPTSQNNHRDDTDLGPLAWMVAEATCAAACAEILGVRVSPIHRRVVGDLSRNCGPVYAFERLCVLSQRPANIERSDGVVTQVRFSDGFVTAQPTR